MTNPKMKLPDRQRCDDAERVARSVDAKAISPDFDRLSVITDAIRWGGTGRGTGPKPVNGGVHEPGLDGQMERGGNKLSPAESSRVDGPATWPRYPPHKNHGTP